MGFKHEAGSKFHGTAQRRQSILPFMEGFSGSGSVLNNAIHVLTCLLFNPHKTPRVRLLVVAPFGNKMKKPDETRAGAVAGLLNGLTLRSALEPCLCLCPSLLHLLCLLKRQSYIQVTTVWWGSVFVPIELYGTACSQSPRPPRGSLWTLNLALQKSLSMSRMALV